MYFIDFLKFFIDFLMVFIDFPVSWIQVAHFNFLKRPVSLIQVAHFNFLKIHSLQEPPLRRDSLLSWTPQGAEARRSGEGKKLDPGVHRGEPNRKGSNKQIAAKQDCYNQPEATTTL